MVGGVTGTLVLVLLLALIGWGLGRGLAMIAVSTQGMQNRAIAFHASPLLIVGSVLAAVCLSGYAAVLIRLGLFGPG